MEVLSGFSVAHLGNCPARGLGWASMGGRGRMAGRNGGGCCLLPRKDCLPAAEAAKQARAGAGEKSDNLGFALLQQNKKLNGQVRIHHPASLSAAATTAHEGCFLPGMELGNPVGGDAALQLYKPYMDHLWATLTDKAPAFRSLDLEPDFRRQASTIGRKTSRVFNWLSSASRLRRIRMTYFDGGTALQAFNSLLYPEFRYDVPLLGIDLLSFGANKILCVIDFIPLIQDPAYLDMYTSQLAPSRAKIEKYLGKMTTKFYDENQFFSKQLIFYRSDLGAKDQILQVPNGLLFSTFVDYIDKYLQILQSAEPNEDPLRMSFVASRQNAYNEHSEERDPAIKIFSKHFGEEWSARFTREFLFQQTAST